jgi:hypothetical protein
MFNALLKDLGLCKKDKLNQAFVAVEQLEARCVPAIGSPTVDIWTDANGTGLWADKLDWSLGHVPQSNEDVLFTTTNPGSGDNCLWAGGTSPAGLFMAANYPGTVTFNAAMEVGIDGMTLDGGKVYQSAAGSTLTVDGAFEMSAGTLNSNTTQSTVTLNDGGVLGGASLYIGSTMNLASGDVSLATTGTVSFLNNAGIVIQSSGGLVWSSAQGNIRTAGTGSISNSGNFRADIGAGNTVVCELPIVNQAAAAYLRVLSGTINFTGRVNGSSVSQSLGRTIIDGGAEMGAPSGYAMSGGNLYTYTGNNTRAVIAGNVSVTGGEIVLKADDAFNCGTLMILGTFEMTNGNLNIKVQSNVNSVCDAIGVAGNITLGGTATVSTEWIGTGEVPANADWTFLSTVTSPTRINGDFNRGFSDFGYHDGTGGTWVPGIDNDPVTMMAHYTLSS